MLPNTYVLGCQQPAAVERSSEVGFRNNVARKFTPSVAYRSGKLRFRPVVSVFLTGHFFWNFFWNFSFVPTMVVLVFFVLFALFLAGPHFLLFHRPVSPQVVVYGFSWFWCAPFTFNSRRRIFFGVFEDSARFFFCAFCAFSGRAPTSCFFTSPFRPRFSSVDLFGVLFCAFPSILFGFLVFLWVF